MSAISDQEKCRGYAVTGVKRLHSSTVSLAETKLAAMAPAATSFGWHLAHIHMRRDPPSRFGPLMSAEVHVPFR